LVRFPIRLDTMTDIQKFVGITTKIDKRVELSDDDGHCVSARSLLGAVASMEWGRTYCTCDEETANKLVEFSI